jgi:hypothetical protein
MKPINFRHRVRNRVHEEFVLPVEQEATGRIVAVALVALLLLLVVSGALTKARP